LRPLLWDQGRGVPFRPNGELCADFEKGQVAEFVRYRNVRSALTALRHWAGKVRILRVASELHGSQDLARTVVENMEIHVVYKLPVRVTECGPRRS
jgi:hypothetical protein